ncbi:MAG TPA: RNA degradosome polyphosphate kinase [Mycobacteriales bacterium]|nr:RNA degradosome polyphosphate kinase [Mycobacteriales bacterium]
MSDATEPNDTNAPRRKRATAATRQTTASRRTTAAKRTTGSGRTPAKAAPRKATADSADVPAVAKPAPRRSRPLPENRYLNRELSWLDFNGRVLAAAEERDRPLLERLKFLAIFATNLDEFFMVRVAGLKRRQSTGISVRSMDRLSPREQLSRIFERTSQLMVRQSRCFVDDIGPALQEQGIAIVHWSDLDGGEQAQLRDYFTKRVFPVLTPLAVDPAHPFPYISGLSLNLAVTVRDPDSEIDRFARIKVPNNVPRFVAVSTEGEINTDVSAAEKARFLPLEDLIAAHLPELFPGMTVVEHHLFRVTRNADFEVEDDRDEDLLQALERELARRRFGPAVRLEVTDSMTPYVLDLLVRELDMSPNDVFRLDGLLDLSALWQLYGIDRPELKDEPFVPATHPRLTDGETPKSVFATLREGDVLVHHPYDSFATSVQRFIEQAAADPGVLAIKQTLYRTSGDSPIVEALIDAAEAQKQVVVVVEIKARFDEQANIGWARALERAGCHVVYGLVGLKTHCKVALVVRQESDGIRRYCHIGTGNYNPKTARLYEDLGLFTADPVVGSDLTSLFNVLTGYSRQTSYDRLLVAPQDVRKGIVRRINREAHLAREGKEGLIQLKVNHLVDEETIDALYRASQAGARIDLLIRTNCALRPGVEGLSENIRVRSIVDRFLEHSRIYRFGNDGDPEYWIGSADLMHRNLDRRIEALVHVVDRQSCSYLNRILDLAMSEDTACWELQPDGAWIQKRSDSSAAVFDYQQELMNLHVRPGE